MKDFMKNNWSLKLLSVVIAVLIWLFVNNINDPTVSKLYTNVNVSIKNGSYIESRGQTYRLAKDNQTVSVTLTGSSSKVSRRTEDISVYADLTQIVDMDSDPIMVPVTVSCPGISEEDITVSPVTIPIEIEDREEKTFMVAVSDEDTTPGKGYEVGEEYSNPDKVTIQGPKSIVSKIDRVVATVSVEGMTADSTKEADLTLYDKNQEVISETDMQYLTFDIGDPKVDVHVKLWDTLSDVSFICEPSGSPAYGFYVASVTTTPDTISIAGTKDALSAIRQVGRKIEIPSDLVSVANARANVEVKLDLKDILPEDVIGVSNTAESVLVEVEILPMGSSKLELSTNDIRLEGLSDDLQAVFTDTKFSVQLEGKEADLEEIKETDVKASVDLEGLTAGTHEVPVELSLPEDISLAEDVKVSIELVRAE